MGGAPIVLAVPRADERDVSAITACLETAFTVDADPDQPVQLIWLDTADHRLYRADLLLGYGRCGDLAWFDLRGRNTPDPPSVPPRPLNGRPSADGGPSGTSSVVAVRPLELSSGPAITLGDLPSPLRERLARIVSIRALLPRYEELLEHTSGRLRDAEGKIVARFAVQPPHPGRTARLTVPEQLAGRPASEEPAGRPPGELPDDRLPGSVQLTPLRGYLREARTAARTLRRAGLVPLAGSPWTPPWTPGEPAAPPRLRPDQPATEGVARMLRHFLDQAEDALPGTLADVDPEFLHDLRVAVRRGRSTLKLLGEVLPADLVVWASGELRWLGDRTTPTRDLDVHLLDIPVLARRLVAARTEDLEAFADHLRRCRAAEQTALVQALTSARCDEFRDRWRAALTSLLTTGSTDPGATTVDALAARRIARVHRRVLRLGAAITEDSPATDLHTVRKRAKELRYLLEIFGSLLADDTEAAGELRGAVRRLKALQDCLGTFQDTEVQRLALRDFAAAVANTATVLALGELAGALAEDQHAARDRFGEVFTQFAAPRARDAIRRFAQPPRERSGSPQ